MVKESSNQNYCLQSTNCRHFSIITSGFWIPWLSLPTLADGRTSLGLHARLARFKYSLFLDQWRPHDFLSSPALSDGTIIISQNIYWHFVVDTLGSLPISKKFINKNLFISSWLTASQIEFLSSLYQLLEVSPKFVFYDGNSIHRISNTYVPRNLGWAASFRKARDIALFYFHRSKANILELQKPRVIFQSRLNARRRRLINEKEVIHELSKFVSVLVVDGDNVSIDEQIRLHYHTAILVGMHGSGLTNFLFCKHAVGLIEIVHTPPEPFFPAISQFLSAKHIFVKGEIRLSSEEKISPTRELDSDCFVNPSHVASALKSLL